MSVSPVATSDRPPAAPPVVRRRIHRTLECDAASMSRCTGCVFWFTSRQSGLGCRPVDVQRIVLGSKLQSGSRTHTHQGDTPMATSRKSGRKTARKSVRRTRRYGPAASKSVESAVRREKRGTLRSGRGGKGGRVKSRKQAIAIGLSEARAKGAKVPSKSRRASSTTRSRSR